jgi:tight adherence protein B
VSAVAAILVALGCAAVVGRFTGTRRGGLVPVETAPRPSVTPTGLGVRQSTWLQQAGLSVTPTAFVAGSVCAGTAAFVVLGVLTHGPFVAIVPACAVALVPRAYYARRRAHRMSAVERSWPDGLRDLLASIGAGRSVGQAVAALAVHGPEPLRDAFERFPSMQRVVGTTAALEAVRDTLGDPTTDRIVEVLIVAHERGGAIVTTILEGLVETTTRDLKVAEEIRSEGLEMKLNARVVVVLPWCVLVLLTAGDVTFRRFYASAAGVVVLGIGALLTLVGTTVLGHLGRDEHEGRVFGVSA